MPGGEEQNTSGTGTVNQAHTTTQIPLPGKFEEATVHKQQMHGQTGFADSTGTEQRQG